MTEQQLLKYAVRIIIIFLVLPIHEFAHAWSAKKLGDNTAQASGRLTINPLAHIDIIGALLLLFTGFGWAKPVPINPIRFKKMRKGIALSALAGPVSNLIVGFIALIIYRFMMYTQIYQELYIEMISGTSKMFYLFYMLEYFAIINVGLAVFNMIPIPPLDGSKVLSYFTSAKVNRFFVENQMYISLVFFALIISGILGGPLSYLVRLVYNGMDFITSWFVEIIISSI